MRNRAVSQINKARLIHKSHVWIRQKKKGEKENQKKKPIHLKARITRTNIFD